MTAQASQAALLVVGDAIAPARASQAALLIIGGETVPPHASQAALLVVGQATPCVTRWAQCWRITRRDGAVLAFTSHDQPLVHQGTTFSPCYSLAASAAELGAVLGQPGNVELAGIIADEAITEADLYAGLYDRALVEVWLVPWQDTAGEVPYRLVAGTTGNLSQGQDGFALEVLTDAARLQQQPLLPAYTPACRWQLGDARCGVDLDALAVNGTVTAVAAKHAATRAHHRIFADSGRSEPDGYFDLGVLEWISGNNDGQRSEIKSYASGQFTLWRPMLHAIAPGDQYEARPGCAKTPAACKGKFNNYANYGGFPDVPGRDAIMQTPNTRQG